MKKESRTVRYDRELQLEAYCFQGITQPFPNHIHEYYVIGLVEQGERTLLCKNISYSIQRGNLILFNPGDSHSCAQKSQGTFSYRGLNLSKSLMLKLSEDITGRRELPVFTENVLSRTEPACYFRLLHQAIMEHSGEFDREENLYLMFSCLLEEYIQVLSPKICENYPQEVGQVCSFIRQHYREHLCLEQLCQCAGLSKSTLLRAFTKSMGITPYRYLQSVRIEKAKEFLEHGSSLLETAIQTGFSDQSHFTNTFHALIGLTPGAYRKIFQSPKDSFNE